MNFCCLPYTHVHACITKLLLRCIFLTVLTHHATDSDSLAPDSLLVTYGADQTNAYD